jgi:hypothetical protein
LIVYQVDRVTRHASHTRQATTPRQRKWRFRQIPSKPRLDRPRKRQQENPRADHVAMPETRVRALQLALLVGADTAASARPRRIGDA